MTITLSAWPTWRARSCSDAHVFTSLPRSGTVRAARLPAEIGDCRARFPTPEALICLAGVAPSTRKSGKTTFAEALHDRMLAHGSPPVRLLRTVV